VAVALQKSLWLSAITAPTVSAGMDGTRASYQATFGENLVLLRSQAGITSQAALAELVGVSESTVQRWESGHGLPDAWELVTLSELLGASIAEILYPEPLSDRERLLLRRAWRKRPSPTD
jgi:transcriptional regulator with XRE-family HTH domain